MHKVMINKPFPAEHPYASHQERKAVFPKFDSPEDYKRGVEARRQRPINDEMPAMPYDITILSKTKGSCRRHELQALPSESLKAPLVWPEHNFDQLVKSPDGGQQVYYPIAPKTLVPNLEARSDSQCIKGNMKVKQQTANTLRNLERNQWQTTYDLNHTGLGPSNPLRLDNYEEKSALRSTGITDQSIDQLKPNSLRTFDPARPNEGRLARAITSAPPLQTDRWPDPPRDPNYRRLKTLSEREEDRLLNGFVHRNYPENSDDEEEEWKIQQTITNPDTQLHRVQSQRGIISPSEVPGYSRGQFTQSETQNKGVISQLELPGAQNKGIISQIEIPGRNSYDQAIEDQYNRFQQVEAQNRFKELELQTPGHNVTARQHKVNYLGVDKEQIKTFYDHEGQYQRERSGMYKTSYDPYTLQASMNKLEDSGGYKFDISEIHKGALDLPVELNQQMHDAMRFNRTLGGPPGSVPQLNSQASPFEVIEPFNKTKSHQKAILQPNMNTSDVRTMEKETILRESTMGDDYNTHKFLQDYDLPYTARKEPTVLMSNQNQDLNQVRVHSQARKGVTWSGKVQVATGGGNEPLRMNSSRESESRDILPSLNKSTGFYSARGEPVLHVTSASMGDHVTLPVSLEKNRAGPNGSRHDMKHVRFGGDDQFTSKSTTFTGPSDLNWTLKSAYAELHPGSSLDMSYKQDKRFKWKSGSGTPRPQTTLLQLQNAFTKSDIRKKFHGHFHEINPDLRENIFRGKQHEFDGMNAQVMRGTPVDAY